MCATASQNNALELLIEGVLLTLIWILDKNKVEIIIFENFGRISSSTVSIRMP